MSILVLLAVIAVGLLSLSSVAVRSGTLGAAQAEARANARLALAMAIGELQKQAGADMRITAPADLLDEANPPLIGVWKSWEGRNHESGRGAFAGRPVRPAYEDKEKAAGAGGRFLSWLVSGAGLGVEVGDAGGLVKREASGDSVPLLAEGSLAAGDERQVHVVPTGVHDGGAMAWWVSGENQKARLPQPYEPAEENPGRWSAMAKSHAVVDPAPFGLERVLEDGSLGARAVTLGTADFLGDGSGATEPGDYFHDLSATSVGLLTNVATGGWRKDLSLLTESWDRQPKARLPFFQLTPGNSTAATIPTNGSPVPDESMLYPWATYRGGQNNIPIYQHGPVSSWANLVDFATHYKRADVSSGGRVTTDTHSVAIDTRAENYDFLHRVRVLPVIARMQWVFSHTAQQLPASRGLYEPRLLLTPVITMWNPYSVEITSPPAMNFSIPKALPAALKYSVGRVSNSKYTSVMAGNNHQPAMGGGSQSFSINQAFTLLPGETRLFSPGSTTPVGSGASLVLEPGYRAGGGHYYQVKDDNGQTLTQPSTARIEADARFDTIYNDRAEGVGIYLDVGISGRRHLVYRMVYTPEMANEVYPPLTNLASSTLGECATNPQPFLSTIFGARTASGTHLAAKGFVQSSPFVNYTAMGRKDEVESTIGRHYGGSGHPVNSPFDYSFIKHAPGGDSFLPNASDRTGRGYIVTGFNKSDGLSRCVIAQLPVRPLVSLAELTHWDLRYENPIPPYAINLIGNSDASPLLPSDAVVNRRDAGLTENLQYDDSYCANHLLFDDWFFSSIAPDPDEFGNSGRTQEEVFTDALSGEAPLPNHAYRPLLEDRASAGLGRNGAGEVFEEHVDQVNSWRTIASRLEVEGMFNVNSTSVTAWRALLGHARNQKVPYVSESGRGGWRVDLSDPHDHVASRFSIAGDTEAGEPGTSGAFPEATEFAGYRTLDGDFLDRLAEEVVVQVRQRGPFLSLAEFVNRQLSSGDLALAGALQAALNELAKSPDTNIYAPLQALSTVASGDPPSPGRAAYDEEYEFREAGVGHSGYGLPGWTRQADLLRPIAPILAARDDTFTIRAHGDARDGQGVVIARATCEAVVRRTREFVDSNEAADLLTAPSRPANRLFGRRFELISFRWLSPEEV